MIKKMGKLHEKSEQHMKFLTESKATSTEQFAWYAGVLYLGAKISFKLICERNEALSITGL